MSTFTTRSPLAFVVVAALACVPVPFHAQGQRTSAGAPERCAAYFEDATSSPVETDVTAARAAFLQGASDAAGRGAVACWRLYRFKADSFHAHEAGRVRLVPFRAPPCDRPPRSELASLVKHVADDEARKSEQRCRELIQRARSSHEASTKAALAAAAQSLSRATPAGACTAVADLLERISIDEDPALPVVVVVTDGRESCRKGALKTIPEPVVKRRVVVTIVGLKTDASSGSGYRQTAALWKKVAPWAEVIPSFGLPRALTTID
jgi:hypothetical protein